MNNAEPQQGELWLVKHEGVEQQAVRTKTDLWFFLSDHFAYLSEVGPIRRLAVVDPEDRESVERLRQAYLDTNLGDATTDMQAALREYANPKPKKPEEPTGLAAVVRDANGVRWTRVEEGDGAAFNPWYPADSDDRPAEWAEIDAIETLSEGVDTKSTT